MRVLTTGYPSLDHIAMVETLGGRGETRVIGTPWPSPTLGGCAANVAVALARLGMRSSTSFAVGDDPESSEFLRVLSRAGVDVSNVVRRTGQFLSRSYLFLDGEEADLFFDPGAMRDWAGPTRLDIGDTGRLVVTVGPLEASEYTIRLAVERGIPIALQLKRDVAVFTPERLRTLLPHCDLVFANREEFKYLLQVYGTCDVAEIIERGPNWIVETRGSAGSVIHHRSGATEVPVVRPIRFVEPTGAGDAFTAGVVFGLMQGLEPLVAARVGAVMASFVVEGWGCQGTLPDLSSLRERYHSTFSDEVMWPKGEEK